MTTMQCTTPWEIVCADFVGPLPRSSKGNTCLLVLIDKFTKWVELVPVRQATTGSVINALKERVIYRFGCPKIVLTDNGRQFVSKEVEKFLKDHGIMHRTTAPYTPQENPTERTNRVVKTMISQWCEENHRQWDAHLPEIAFAINTGVHESTSQSAAVLNYGRNPPPPCQVRREGRTPQESSQTIDMPKLWGKAAAAAREATAKQAKYFNAKVRQWRPQKGEVVYKREHPLSNANKHFAQKLAPRFSGPYTVVGHSSPTLIQLSDPITSKTTTVHVKDLKPYSLQPDDTNAARTSSPSNQTRAIDPPEPPRPFVPPPEARPRKAASDTHTPLTVTPSKRPTIMAVTSPSNNKTGGQPTPQRATKVKPPPRTLHPRRTEVVTAQTPSEPPSAPTAYAAPSVGRQRIAHRTPRHAATQTVNTTGRQAILRVRQECTARCREPTATQHAATQTPEPRASSAATRRATPAASIKTSRAAVRTVGTETLPPASTKAPPPYAAPAPRPYVAPQQRTPDLVQPQHHALCQYPNTTCCNRCQS